MPNNQSNNTMYVYIDYHQNGLWGAWYSKHSWWERAGLHKMPNILHSNPTHICELAKKYLGLREQDIQLVFSDAVRFLHEVESRSIQ